MFRQHWHVPDGKPKSANTNKQRIPTQYPISQPVTVTPIMIQVPRPRRIGSKLYIRNARPFCYNIKGYLSYKEHRTHVCSLSSYNLLGSTALLTCFVLSSFLS